MYQYMFRHIHGLMLDALLAHPEGLSLNALARLLRGRAARSVVLREVRVLSEMGLVSILRDERHRQRRIVRPEREVAELMERFRELRPSNFEEALRNIPRMLLLLREVKGRSGGHLVEYLKYRMREDFSHILEVIV